ncbi:hypothetical protein AAVH_27842, partial [Aphelenchoides avenae]
MTVFIIIRALRGDTSFRQAFFMQYVAVSVVECLRIIHSILHVLIAANRLTAFFFPLEHSSIWRNRVVVGSTAAVLVTSVLLHIVSFYLLQHLLSVMSSNVIYGIDGVIDDMLTTVICALCAVGSFLISIVTLLKLRALTRSGQLRDANTRRDMALL